MTLFIYEHDVANSIIYTLYKSPPRTHNSHLILLLFDPAQELFFKLPVAILTKTPRLPLFTPSCDNLKMNFRHSISSPLGITRREKSSFAQHKLLIKYSTTSTVISVMILRVNTSNIDSKLRAFLKENLHFHVICKVSFFHRHVIT